MPSRPMETSSAALFAPFADETQTDLTGDLVLSGPHANNETKQLVGSRYDPALAWRAASAWTLTTSADGGATVAVTSDLAVRGDLLISASKSRAASLSYPFRADQPLALHFWRPPVGRRDRRLWHGSAQRESPSLGRVVFQKTGMASSD